LVDDVFVFVDEVEQASDLGDGEGDQATDSVWTVRSARRVGVVRV
jgi:hypothetical protein